MRIIEPIDITDGALTSNIAVDSDSVFHGEDWSGLWAVDTTYAEGKIVYKGIELYESLVPDNLGNDPETTNNEKTETPSWLKRGKINRWRMFDGVVGSITEAPEGIGENPSVIDVTVGFTKNVNYCAFFGIEGQTVEFTLKDGGGVTRWQHTRDLRRDPVYGWEEYFFSPLAAPINDFSQVLGRLELVGSLQVTITNSVNKAKCGLMILGRTAFIGQAKYGISSGIMSFSRKQKDDFGRTFLKAGNTVKLMKCDLFLNSNLYDRTQQLLQKYEAKAIVWDANAQETDYSSFVVYGFPRDFRLVMENHGIAQCSLDIEGLI